MLHKMKLNESPFERIKNGTKTIEFRLYDEKRQQVKVGDQIEFSKLPNVCTSLNIIRLSNNSFKYGTFGAMKFSFFPKVTFNP